MTIYIIAHGTGGANAYKSIIEELENKGSKYNIKLVSIGEIPYKVWKKRRNIIKVNNFEDIELLFYKDKPYMVFSETSSANNVITYQLSRYCIQEKINHISLLDLWGNLGKRFVYLPNYIISPCEYATKELLYYGVKEESILKLGNPHFERCLQIDNNVVDKYRNKNKENIVFISQCFKEHGYLKTQEEWFKNWYVTIENKLNKNIMIKAHPQEEKTWLRNIEGVKLIEDDVEDITSFCMYMDKIVGINSTVLYELLLLNMGEKLEILDKDFVVDLINMQPYKNATNNIIKYFELI